MPLLRLYLLLLQLKRLKLRLVSDVFGGTWKAFGVKATIMFYPATEQDLSSLGTKVAVSNPAMFMTVTGADVTDGQVMNAVMQAGYKGQLINIGQTPIGVLSQILSPQALEGFTSGALPIEFDPPLTQAAKDFKDAWIAKYGKWENPNLAFSANFPCLVAAIQQAGSLDTDKVAAVRSGRLP